MLANQESKIVWDLKGRYSTVCPVLESMILESGKKMQYDINVSCNKGFTKFELCPLCKNCHYTPVCHLVRFVYIVIVGIDTISLKEV